MTSAAKSGPHEPKLHGWLEAYHAPCHDTHTCTHVAHITQAHPRRPETAGFCVEGEGSERNARVSFLHHRLRTLLKTHRKPISKTREAILEDRPASDKDKKRQPLPSVPRIRPRKLNYSSTTPCRVPASSPSTPECREKPTSSTPYPEKYTTSLHHGHQI